MPAAAPAAADAAHTPKATTPLTAAAAAEAMPPLEEEAGPFDEEGGPFCPLPPGVVAVAVAAPSLAPLGPLAVAGGDAKTALKPPLTPPAAGGEASPTTATAVAAAAAVACFPLLAACSSASLRAAAVSRTSSCFWRPSRARVRAEMPDSRAWTSLP